MSELTHIGEDGAARMVDVTTKHETQRRAVASGQIALSAAVRTALRDGTVPKGDVWASARIAGIMAAKRCADLIPLCHPLPIGGVSVDFAEADGGILVRATVVTSAATGVEMEAMTAVSIALLTIYDMVKAMDRSAVIGAIRLDSKSGGKSGAWNRA